MDTDQLQNDNRTSWPTQNIYMIGKEQNKSIKGFV